MKKEIDDLILKLKKEHRVRVGAVRNESGNARHSGTYGEARQIPEWK